jgi:uncharacterized membrane protein
MRGIRLSLAQRAGFRWVGDARESVRKKGRESQQYRVDALRVVAHPPVPNLNSDEEKRSRRGVSDW